MLHFLRHHLLVPCPDAGRVAPQEFKPPKSSPPKSSSPPKHYLTQAILVVCAFCPLP